MGSEKKAAVWEELSDYCVQMFVWVLRPHSILPPDQLERRWIGLVAGGEALACTGVRGNGTEADAVTALLPRFFMAQCGASRKNILGCRSFRAAARPDCRHSQQVKIPNYSLAWSNAPA